MLTLDEALKILRVDEGANDELIISLLTAIPPYIETTTGLATQYQKIEPLVKTVSGFLLKQWYFADQADDISLTRTIDALLKAITIRTRSRGVGVL